MQVKICGINDPAAFDAAIAAGADWVGFNFFPPSPRFVTPRTAAELSARSPAARCAWGCSSIRRRTTIAATLETVRLDILQLYGALDLPALRARFGLPIWRAVGVATAADLPTDAGGADRLLLEAKPPPEATRPGGNAVRFDWSLLRGWSAPAPWILAGGLTVDNVAEAIRITGATAVDVSSGVERDARREGPGADPRLHRQCPRGGIRFRRATPADADALGDAHVEAWREAYAGLVPDAVLAALDPQQRAAMWRDALAKGAAVHLAERNGAIVGFGSGGPQRDAVAALLGRDPCTVRAADGRSGRGSAACLMAAVARDLLAQGHVLRRALGDGRQQRRPPLLRGAGRPGGRPT